jgi:hypothetical protein
VTGPHGFVVARSAAEQTGLDVAFDGTNFFAVWGEWRQGSFDIYGARQRPNGSMLDGAGIPVATGAVQQFHPAVAWNGAQYLVVWQQGAAIYGARVTPGGTVVDSIAIHIGAGVDAQNPDVAWDGSNFLVVWQDVTETESTFDSDIAGARVSANGTVLDPSGISISTAASTQTMPAVASNGTASLVVWQDDRSGVFTDVYGARVRHAGVVRDPSGIAISVAARSQFDPSVASNGTGYQVLWSDYRNGDVADIFGARVASSGTIFDPTGKPISTAPGNQSEPSVAFNGRFVALWRDERNDPFGDIYGARLHNGAAVDVSGVPVAAAPTSERGPALTAGAGSGFGAAYQRFAPTPPYGTDRAFLRTLAPK